MQSKHPNMKSEKAQKEKRQLNQVFGLSTIPIGVAKLARPIFRDAKISIYKRCDFYLIISEKNLKWDFKKCDSLDPKFSQKGFKKNRNRYLVLNFGVPSHPKNIF